MKGKEKFVSDHSQNIKNGDLQILMSSKIIFQDFNNFEIQQSRSSIWKILLLQKSVSQL